MQKLAMILTAAVFALGMMAVSASAQTQVPGAGSLHAQLHNATPFKLAACRGWGPYCPPGRVRRCGPFRCWCAPCW